MKWHLSMRVCVFVCVYLCIGVNVPRFKRMPGVPSVTTQALVSSIINARSESGLSKLPSRPQPKLS